MTKHLRVKASIAALLITVSSLTSPNVGALSEADYPKNDIFWYSKKSVACTQTAESELKGEDNLKKIFNYFISKGVSIYVAAAVVGNIYQESKGDPLLVQGGGRSTDPSTIGRYSDGSMFENKPGQSSVGKAWGLAQWDPGNAVLYWQKQAGVQGDVTSVRVQLDIIWWQLKNLAPTSKKNVLGEMEASGNVDKATEIMVKRFFGAGKPMLETRQKKAREAMSWPPQVSGLPTLDAGIDNSNSCDPSGVSPTISEGGLTEEQAKLFVMNYGENKNGDSRKYASPGSWGRCGGNGANCVTFSRFFINKFTTTKISDGEATGDGENVVSFLRSKGVQTGTEPRVGAVFSWSGGAYGHTGVVLGIHDGKVVVGQASCTDGNNGYRGRGTGNRNTGKGAAFVRTGDPKTGSPWYKKGAGGVTFAYPEVDMKAIEAYLGGGGTSGGDIRL